MLELDGVSTRYGPITMLRDVSLALEAGRVAGLLGPNGSGKTTLIRTILRLLPPGRGGLRLGGARIDRPRTPAIGKRGLRGVPEGRRGFPQMSVAENPR